MHAMVDNPATQVTAADAAFDWIDQFSADRDRAGLTRILRPRADRDTLLDLASNDYLGLSRHPEVTAASVAATQRWGTGSTGSRLVTGSTELHEELESELAGCYGAESALVFSSGYAANLAAVTALTAPSTLVVSDQHNHASLIDGCRLSRAKVAVTPHCDVGAVSDRLSTVDGNALVLTESVFSVDGDTAPISGVHQACSAKGAALLVDDAHGLGVIGPGGLGAFAAAGLSFAPNAVSTVTLSKALGAQGGAVLGPRRVIHHLTQAARTFIFDTGLAPASAAAALASLRLIKNEPWRSDRVRWVADELHARLSAAGVPVSTPGAAVIGVPAGSPSAATTWAAKCRAQGLLVGCFRPPSVPDESSRLRLTARANLTEEQIAYAVDVIASTAPER